jgi:hypothetical protein
MWKLLIVFVSIIVVAILAAVWIGVILNARKKKGASNQTSTNDGTVAMVNRAIARLKSILRPGLHIRQDSHPPAFVEASESVSALLGKIQKYIANKPEIARKIEGDMRYVLEDVLAGLLASYNDYMHLTHGKDDSSHSKTAFTTILNGLGEVEKFLESLIDKFLQDNNLNLSTDVEVLATWYNQNRRL